MEIEYPTLPLLTDAIGHRREAGDIGLTANDTKTRRVGFVVGPTGPSPASADEYHFVRMKNLTPTEMASLPEFIEQVPPDLAGMWDRGIESDIMDKTDELAEGERVARVSPALLPSSEQMAVYVALIEQGLRDAGFDWATRSYPASPFTFSWGTASRKEHHTILELRTDHAGVNVTVGDKDGVEWSGIQYAQRIAWADATEERGWPVPAWVALYAKRAMGYYEVAPQCDCRDHQDRRTGRFK